MLPLVLLPGMMCDARLFGPQTAAISGQRAVHIAPITAHDRVEDLAAEVLANAPSAFALAGLSMGGIVAMEIVKQAPERVRKVALLDTNPMAENAEIQARRLTQIEKARSGQLDAVLRKEMKPNYLADGPNRAVVLDLCMDMALGLGADVFVRQSTALAKRPDQTDTLRNADIPALILCGRHDVLCPVHRHELMHDLMPNSTLQIIETAGHLATLEAPDETSAALTRWLEI